VVKGSDEKIHLAIDACDVCYESKLGYKQTGNVMTCNNCGQTFPINSIGTENLKGGSWTWVDERRRTRFNARARPLFLSKHKLFERTRKFKDVKKGILDDYFSIVEAVNNLTL